VNVLVALRFAARGLGANKLRSMLTTLGILIGVASVIVLLAVGTGSAAEEQVSAVLGAVLLLMVRRPGPALDLAPSPQT